MADKGEVEAAAEVTAATEDPCLSTGTPDSPKQPIDHGEIAFRVKQLNKDSSSADLASSAALAPHSERSETLNALATASDTPTLGADIDTTRHTPITGTPSDLVNAVSRKETRRKASHWKRKKEKKGEDKASEEKFTSLNLQGPRDTTNRRSQNPRTSKSRPTIMKRKGEKALFAVAPNDAKEHSKEDIASSEISKTTEATPTNFRILKNEKDAPQQKDGCHQSAVIENAKEEPKLDSLLDKWNAVFPPGGPRPIPEPANDDHATTTPRRTNYIDELGNYHAPNGSIIGPELLNLFSKGKICNSFGDTVYFNPSFLEDIPPKDQSIVTVSPTPYYIFYNPYEIEE